MLCWPRLLPLHAAIATLVAAFASTAHGQSLIDLYNSAREFDASYQSARAQYDANLARAAQSRAGILPSIGMTAGATRTQYDIDTAAGNVSRGLPTQSAGINASQPLYRPANWATYEQGKLQVDIAYAVLDTAEQDLIVRVSQAYFDVLAAQDNLSLVGAQKAAVAEQLASAKRNFEVGTSTITDSREAQARFDLVVAQEIAFTNDLQVRKLVLDQLVGRPGTVPGRLNGPVILPKVVPANVDTWLSQAEDAHPAIRQARLGIDVAELEVQKAEAGHKPTLDATLGYNVSNNPQGTVTSQGRQRVNAASIGINFNLPLFAGFAVQNRVKETLALEAQSRAGLDSARRGVAQATQTAFLGLISGAGQVKALEAAEASSQSALDANQLGYKVGVRINIDVLNAQSQLFQTKRDLAQARYNVLVGNLRLRQANGTLKADDLQPIDAMVVGGGKTSRSSQTVPATFSLTFSVARGEAVAVTSSNNPTTAVVINPLVGEPSSQVMLNPLAGNPSSQVVGKPPGR